MANGSDPATSTAAGNNVDAAVGRVQETLFDVAAAARRYVRCIQASPNDPYGAQGPREQLVAAVDAHEDALVALGRVQLEKVTPRPPRADPLPNTQRVEAGGVSHWIDMPAPLRDEDPRG